MRRNGTVLLYSPRMFGHRHFYCWVLASTLAEQGYRVIVAGSMSEDGRPVRYGSLEDLAATRSASFVDTAQCLDGSFTTARGLASLIRDVGADTTVLMEADDEIPLLVSQMRGRDGPLPGRRVGIFLRSTGYVYGQPKRPLRRRVRRALRTSRWSEDPRLFHRLLLPRFRLLDAACCLDEVFVAATCTVARMASRHVSRRARPVHRALGSRQIVRV